MAPFAPLEILPCAGGCLLRVRVKPKAREERLIGAHAGGVKLSVQAPPERGKANDAVRGLLARLLDLPPSSIAVASGAASQDKIVRLDGISPAECGRRLAAHLEAPPENS
jgi:uncharacterized protein YggU (UPF0235/DUF167 family)